MIILSGVFNRPIDHEALVPHPRDEVRSVLMLVGPLVVAEQFAGVAEHEQLCPGAALRPAPLLLTRPSPVHFADRSAEATACLDTHFLYFCFFLLSFFVPFYYL